MQGVLCQPFTRTHGEKPSPVVGAHLSRQRTEHYTFFEELDLPDEVRQKIHRTNAEKVYGLSEKAK